MSEETARGARAAHEYDELKAAFEAVRQALLKEISQTPVGADAKILKLHMSVQNLAAVEQAMRQVIDSGRIVSAMEAQTALAVAGLNRPT